MSNLKKGLTSLGKGVGGALKNIGKKIGEILPGMVGAIASFVFKTAGEAVGFLAKHAWLWIFSRRQYDKKRNIYDADRFIDKCFLESKPLF